MRYVLLLAAVAGLSFVTVSSAPAQVKAGHILVGDNSGGVYQVPPQGGPATLVAKAPSAVYGLDVDYNGDLILGGSAILWHVDGPSGKVTTIKTGSPLTSLQGDIEISQKGTFYVNSMGVNTVWEMDNAGTVITQYAMTGSTRTWGMGLDRKNNVLYVIGLTICHALDLTSGSVKTIYTGAPLNFCQGACMGPNGNFAFADETGQEFFEVDSTGVLTTIYSGAPFVDPGEGVDLLPSGDYVLADDASGKNFIWLVTPSSPALVTTLHAGLPFSDTNGCTVVPDLLLNRVGPLPKPGQPAAYRVTSAGAQYDYYIFGASLSASRGFALPGGKYFPLDFDPLLGLTLSNVLPGVFRNFQGFIDVSGQAVLTVNVPNAPALAGVEYYMAGVTINPNAPAGIHLVSNPIATRIQS